MIAAVAVCASLAVAASKPEVVAHRGYWKTDGSAQNSIRSLVKADSIGCFATEFDVWITADDTLVVNHDPSINGVVIETSPASEVKAQVLSNGEHLPSLEEYLVEASKLPNLRLVCELKPHQNAAREKLAVKSILELMKKYGLENRVDYITFSRNGFVILSRMRHKEPRFIILAVISFPNRSNSTMARALTTRSELCAIILNGLSSATTSA